jgi:hypothetical protein
MPRADIGICRDPGSWLSQIIITPIISADTQRKLSAGTLSGHMEPGHTGIRHPRRWDQTGHTGMSHGIRHRHPAHSASAKATRNGRVEHASGAAGAAAQRTAIDGAPHAVRLVDHKGLDVQFSHGPMLPARARNIP